VESRSEEKQDSENLTLLEDAFPSWEKSSTNSLTNGGITTEENESFSWMSSENPTPISSTTCVDGLIDTLFLQKLKEEFEIFDLKW